MPFITANFMSPTFYYKYTKNYLKNWVSQWELITIPWTLSIYEKERTGVSTSRLLTDSLTKTSEYQSSAKL